jgi:hypothetical protein
MFYPGDARVPEALRSDEFLVRPLRATDVALDYDAVISSRAELLVSSGGTWPREGFTLEENRADLERHEREHGERIAFTYTVMNPSETECLGCVYLSGQQAPPLKAGDAWPVALLHALMLCAA